MQALRIIDGLTHLLVYLCDVHLKEPSNLGCEVLVNGGQEMWHGSQRIEQYFGVPFCSSLDVHSFCVPLGLETLCCFCLEVLKVLVFLALQLIDVLNVLVELCDDLLVLVNGIGHVLQSRFSVLNRLLWQDGVEMLDFIGFLVYLPGPLFHGTKGGHCVQRGSVCGLWKRTDRRLMCSWSRAMKTQKRPRISVCTYSSKSLSVVCSLNSVGFR